MTSIEGHREPPKAVPAIPASDIVWIPSVPEPFHGSTILLRSVLGCECGATFKGKNRDRDYRAHWRRHHDEAHRKSGPQMGVTRREAQELYAEAARYGGDGG